MEKISSGRGFSTMSVTRKVRGPRGSTFTEEYLLMAAVLTSWTPTQEAAYFSAASMSWPMTGLSERMMSSPSKTAKGSSPTKRLARQMAWPRPLVSFCRT